MNDAEKGTVDLYTDGACKGNPGPGGWGLLLRYGGAEKTLCGGEGETTNNRMELTAVIRGLQALNRSCRVRVHTDSQYVQKGISEWLPNWVRRNWKTAGGGAVKNQDLWRELADQAARHQVEWHWVKGHAGHPENERADALANEGVRQAMAGRAR
ncbi:MAG TPA: ribonuclease HI [Thiobacillaceae bacterium]|nr:ribonuclease HI [Thiobacillaceae bacterium]HNA81682.1 ribonuclease HI [Thiobacillaceae bacterium]HNF87947.1 ribonuclease HI [Thiobacillaceae bacterium]HNH88152.1 ribonuclease HI [Thiobacillaceae bacterium]HNI07106.1 ribonuclease HI [Thiobacillaceae bacterium]